MIMTVKHQQNGYLVNDSMCVPNDTANKEYQEVQEWIVQGGVIEPEFPHEELQAKAYEEAITTWKTNRQNLVDNIEVTYDGVVYQGDEVSQTRMSRAITALPDDTTTVPWVAKDNTVHSLNRVELKGLLFQSGLEQSTIWNEGRPE